MLPVEDIIEFVEASTLYTIPDVNALVEYCLTSDDLKLKFGEVMLLPQQSSYDETDGDYETMVLQDGLFPSDLVVKYDE